MTSFVLVIGIFFCYYFVSYISEGKVHLPPGGSRLTFAPGTTAKIKWSFDARISKVIFRAWYFTSSDSAAEEVIAYIRRDFDIEIVNSSLPGVAIEKPATLVLENVDSSYNGTYGFQIAASGEQGSIFEVAVFIAITPTVKVNCSSSITVNEGNDIICVCEGKGGNPPADVIWFSDVIWFGIRIDLTANEEQTLTLSNVDKTDSGRYTCVAQSYGLAKNETSIEVIVNYAPEELCFNEEAVVGESFTIKCEAADGHPEPSYTIIHNNTEVVSTEKTYTIPVVNKSHAGLYKCIAENKLGKISKDYNLSVIVDQLITRTTGTTNANFPTTNNSGKAGNKTDDGKTMVAWHILVSFISGLIMGILISYIGVCCRRRFSTRKHQSNPEPQAPKDSSIYQELDLTKMNSEDNYQSLMVNSTNNQPEREAVHVYMDLNQGTRDDDNQYQKLNLT